MPNHTAGRKGPCWKLPAKPMVSIWRHCQLGTSTLPVAMSSLNLSRWRQGTGKNRVCPHLQLCFFSSKNLESFIVVTMANSPRPSIFTLVSSTTKVFFCVTAALRNARLPQSGHQAQCNHVVRDRLCPKELHTKNGEDWYFTVQSKEGRSDETVKSTREEVVPPLICMYFSEPAK